MQMVGKGSKGRGEGCGGRFENGRQCDKEGGNVVQGYGNRVCITFGYNQLVITNWL